MKTTSSYNSTKNQEIKGKFVQREVIQNVSLLMQHFFQTEDRGEYEDEIFSLGSQPNYESAAEQNGWTNEEQAEIWTNEETDEVYDTAQEVCEGENLDYDYLEPYEFYIVSDWLGEKLMAQGEIVEEVFNLTIWGRCTTGQAILLDNVISEICEELEILEGQRSDWSKQ